ncbi:MAG: hypothetical protein P4L22_07340 [Candidatus Babeliales bacterium]|nr:hypothetical protein [Candidatus Babeliales bacterium]
MKNYLKILFFLSCYALQALQPASSSSSAPSKCISNINPIMNFKEFKSAVTSVQISPNNKFLAASGVDGKVIIWNLDSGKVFNTLEDDPENSYARGVSWSPDSSKLAAIYRNKKIIIWNVDPESGRDLILGSDIGLSDIPIDVAWSPVDESLIAIAIGNNVVIYDWDPETLDINPLIILRGHTAKINSISWSPKGSRLVSGSSDKTVRIWNVKNKSELKNISETDSVNKVSYSPDAQYIIYSMVDKTLTILNDSYERVEKLNIFNNALALEWAPNSNLFVYGNTIGEIKICNLEGNLVKKIKQDTPITGLCWSKDCDFLASSSADGSVVVEPVEISIYDLLAAGIHFDFINNELYLNNLELTSLKGLEKIPNINMIDTLNISFNNLKNLDNLRNLRNLKIVNLSNNKIKHIKLEDFEGLEALEAIILNDNKIPNIDFDLQLLRNNHRMLKDLIILNNPLDSLTKLMLKQFSESPKAKESEMSVYY